MLAWWNNTTTIHHPKLIIRPMGHLDKGAEKDYREPWVCGLKLLVEARITDGRDYKHACANHLLDTFKETVFTQYLLFNPFNPLIPILNTL